MRKLLAIFFQARNANPWTVLGALLLAALVETASFATLLPLVSIVTTPEEEMSGFHETVVGVLQTLHVPVEMGPLLVLFAALMALRSLIGLIAMRHVGNTSAEVATDLRRRIVANVLGVRWQFLVAQPLGRIAATISNDANRSGKAYLQVAQFVALMMQTVVFITFAVVINWRFALLALAAALIIGASLWVFVRMAKRSGFAQTLRNRELLIYFTDTISNIKPVKAMGREAPFASLLEGRIYKLRRALRAEVTSEYAAEYLQDILMAILLAVGLYLAVVVLQMPIPEVLVTGVVINRTAGSVNKLQRTFQRALLLESAYYSAHELIEETGRQAERHLGGRTPSLDRAIRFENVSFAHTRQPVLREVDLSIEAGEHTVLIGPSGSGKTTLVDLLLGLHQPSAGRILVDGVSLSELDMPAWRRMVGYVPQELALLHDTIRTNITLGDATIDDRDIEDALAMAGARDFVAAQANGLETVVGEKGARLSGGQRQRIAFARALAGKPRLLILDEVTSALDPDTANELALQIRNLTGRVTMLSITHREEFLSTADRVYRIERGAVIEQPAARRDLAAV